MGFVVKLTIAMMCFIVLTPAAYLAQPSKHGVTNTTLFADAVRRNPFFPFTCDAHFTQDTLILNTTNRNGVIPDQYRWPFGIIPYVYESSVKDEHLAELEAGFELIQSTTCLRFVKRTVESNYVTIGTTKPGCYCEGIGMRGGPQYINLNASYCVFASGFAHELLHAAGLYHEHTRPDRDDYITVVWENIEEKYKSQYKRCDEIESPYNDGCSTYGQAYSFKSIMHYHAGDDDKPTMISKIPGQKPPYDHRTNNKLTPEDAAKINIMYNNCK